MSCHHPLLHWLLLMLTVTSTGGCLFGGDRVPPAELDRTETAILEAKQLGAERYAASSLRFAEERLASGRHHIDQGNHEQAGRMLQEARVLAERAEAESLAEQTVHASQVIQQTLDQLRRQLEAAAEEP